MRKERGSAAGTANRKRRWVRRLKRTVWATAAVLLAMFIGGGGYLWSVFNSVSGRVAQLSRIELELQLPPTQIISADNVVLCVLAAERRDPVDYSQIPELVINATVAAEDKRFWDHSGVDFTAITRAIFVNVRSGSVRQGGSTITQQVAKRLLTSGERTFRRKVEDACLALQIERQYTKEQIVTLYLNQVFYGSQAYGIKAAAATYFDKDLDELTPGEAALLARLPRRPSDENPFVNLDAARANRNIVLAIMRDEGWITRAEYAEAIDEPIKLAPFQAVQQTGIRHAPYFVTWVLEEMRREFPNEDYRRGGYKIYTTLNLEAQKHAEKAVANAIKDYKNRRVTEGAVVVMSMDGQVLALVGGSDFKRSQYNAITQGLRPPGSAFKPFVYAAALDKGVIKPNSRISNAKFSLRDPATGKVWSPKGGGSGGTVSVQDALVRSINTPAVHVGWEVGPGNVANFTREVFGISSMLDPVASLPLGPNGVNPLEMAEAYSVFATGGSRVKAHGIRRVEEPDGSLIRVFRPQMVPNVLSASTAEVMHDILRRVVSSGTGTAANAALNAAGKTGTTNSHRDAWFCGYTEQLVAVAWVANATYNPERTPAWQYGPMDGIFGGRVSARIWAQAVRPIQEIVGEEKSSYRPRHYAGTEAAGSGRDTINVLICVETGDRANSGCPFTEPTPMTASESREMARCTVHAARVRPAETDDVATSPPPPPDTEPPPDTPPPSTPPGVPPGTSAENRNLVALEVCVETGSRATTYCRLKRTQSFRRGSEPAEVCRLHRP